MSDDDEHGCRCHINPPCSHCTDCHECFSEDQETGDEQPVCGSYTQMDHMMQDMCCATCFHPRFAHPYAGSFLHSLIGQYGAVVIDDEGSHYIPPHTDEEGRQDR
jgi:hypothetical protein